MTRKTLFSLLLGVAASPAFAQINSSVNVEGEYQPIIIQTERLNTFPQGYRYELPAVNLDYEFTGIVADYKPNLLKMGVIARQTERDVAPRGFVDFRIGSYLNTRLHAGYTVLSDSVNSLTAQLKFTSSSLYRTHGVPDSYTRLPRKRLYEGELGADYSRLMGREGLLNASFGYRVGYFNYYGTTVENTMLPISDESLQIPTQTFNQLGVKAGYVSSPSLTNRWHLGGSLDFLAYRRLYSPVYGFDPFVSSDFLSQRGDRETRIDISGGVAFPLKQSSALSIDAEGEFLFYPDRKPEVLGVSDYKRKNYGVVTLTPAYRLENNGLSIEAGADLAVSYNAMGAQAGKHFGAFHVAPDVSIQYGSRAGVGIFLTATGGITPSTLLLKERFDRYLMPWQLSTLPVYSPLDARLGLNFGPFAGFTGQIDFRYAVAKNTPLGGWYQAYLGAYSAEGPFYPGNLYTDPYAQTLNLHGLSLGFDLRYAFGSKVEIGFAGTYTAQNGKKGIFNGFDRPRWILDAKASARPIKRLGIDLSYGYRGVRNCYTWAATDFGISADRRLVAYKLPDITDLNLKVGYDLLDNLNIYCQLDNILNRRVDILPGLQSEGIVVSAGFTWDIR